MYQLDLVITLFDFFDNYLEEENINMSRPESGIPATQNTDSLIGKVKPEPESKPVKKVDIYGAGIGGTITAIRLLQLATEPLEINFLEMNEERRHGGISCSKDTAAWVHLLNVQGGYISAFPEDPNNFIDWTNKADRKSWPTQWKNTEFKKSTYLPRRTYQLYLGDQLKQAEVNAAPGVTLRRPQGEAIDLVENDTTATTTYTRSKEDRSKESITNETDKVIIATGPIDFVIPTFAEKVKYDPHFVLNQYSPEGRKVIKKLDKNATAFIIGTGLSAFDAAISLLENGHEGPIIMSSRHGYTHFTYIRS